MSVDPQVKVLLEQVLAQGGLPLESLSVPEARQLLVQMSTLQGELPEVGHVENRRIPGPAGEIPVRVYTPKSPRPLPVLVYFHGGGWVLGDLETTEGICRSLANAARCLVVSVDYRLAPEHKFPAAVEDAYAATQWVAANAATLGGDSARLAVAGDSAGGNLAAVVALMARDRRGPVLRQQVLIYPVTDAGCNTASYRENGKDYLLTTEAMQWFWNHYTRNDADRRNPYAAPLAAENLQGVAPAFVVTAEFDPLRDEGEAYAARLRAAGVEVQMTRYAGMIHGFFGMGGVIDRSRTAVQDVATALQSAWATGSR